MANNRMYLLNRPTGLAVMLGKHMGIGWYRGPDRDLLELLYEEVDKRVCTLEDMEDFCIYQEDCSAENPLVTTDWVFCGMDEKEPRLHKFKPAETQEGQ